MFAIKKLGGWLWRIVDCRSLNTQLKSQHLKMNNLNKVLEVWNKDDWASLIDIKSAFNHKAITGELDKYLVFTYRQIHYAQVGMSIGISVAPKTFAKTIQITTSCFSIGKAKALYHLRKAIDSIIWIEQENGWTLTIRRIAGKWNKEVGALSRLSIAGDYSIKNEVLEDVLKDWKVEITVDLLAARNYAKHKKFFTSAKDKKEQERDSMKISCEEEFTLICPPIPIIKRVISKIIEERVQGIIIVSCWPGQVWWTQLKEITVREKEFGESEKVFEMGSMMKKRNMKVLPGRILALEVNGDKTEQDYFEMSWMHPDSHENQLDLQSITGLDVEKCTPAPYRSFGTI
ncbi:MAG: hypothetical protein EZS28_022441 [Streblomastix strix]|uniref:Reverse transcriptase domain-containing protein n=1 Tax=Streblomastix strix TaxID=222440 RepID=A0A5J4VHL9_9EUKA|nr:MAG: hypothetical protein EZS28_022441 [Streblomastix strix]